MSSAISPQTTTLFSTEQADDANASLWAWCEVQIAQPLPVARVAELVERVQGLPKSEVTVARRSIVMLQNYRTAGELEQWTSAIGEVLQQVPALEVETVEVLDDLVELGVDGEEHHGEPVSSAALVSAYEGLDGPCIPRTVGGRVGWLLPRSLVARVVDTLRSRVGASS